MSKHSAPYEAPAGYSWRDIDNTMGRAHGGNGPVSPEWVLFENPEPGYEFAEVDVDLSKGNGDEADIVKQKVYRKILTQGGRRRNKRKNKKTQRRRR
jgi:hypothetical protein